MSQHIAMAIQRGISPPECTDTLTYNRELEMVERYLAVLEDNRNACRADLGDVDIALDMAGFVRQTLRGAPVYPRMSSALMALALVRREPDMTMQ